MPHTTNKEKKFTLDNVAYDQGKAYKWNHFVPRKFNKQPAQNEDR